VVTKRIATIGPDLRLVVINFLVKTGLVPAVIPVRTTDRAARDFPVSGELVLPSTKDIDVYPLLEEITSEDSSYVLVDAWTQDRPDLQTKHRQNPLSDVRFVFCHLDHLVPEGLNPEFLARRDEIIDSLKAFIYSLWRTMAYRNPYYLLSGSDQISNESVLMVDCNGRNPLKNSDGTCRTVYENGRDQATNRGLGQKVPMINLAKKLQVKDGIISLV